MNTHTHTYHTDVAPIEGSNPTCFLPSKQATWAMEWFNLTEIAIFSVWWGFCVFGLKIEIYLNSRENILLIYLIYSIVLKYEEKSPEQINATYYLIGIM